MLCAKICCWKPIDDKVSDGSKNWKVSKETCKCGLGSLDTDMCCKEHKWTVESSEEAVVHCYLESLRK